jgi:uncharacterized glyoxalase superfamily protein PhnB
MAVRRAMFVIAVRDLERSSAFYRDVLGFEVRDIGDPGWRMYVREECRIMAGECPGAIPAAQLGDHSYFAYLVVDDVEAWHERAAATGAEIVKQLASDKWGMREFGLRTVDGHRIMLGQEIRSGGS